VTQQSLNDDQIRPLVEQVGRETMPQHMRRAFPQARCGRSFGKHLSHRVLVDMARWRAARKQPVRGSVKLPIDAQQVQQSGRQQGIPLLVAFAVPHPQHHALGVDVCHSQLTGFADP
jgi:hypothetical protein